MTPYQSPMRSDKELRLELYASLTAWRANLPVPATPQLQATTVAVASRINELRAELLDLQKTFSRLSGRKGNRSLVEARAQIHQELQVLVPALRCLRGALCGHAAPWRRLCEQLLRRAVRLNKQLLNSTSPRFLYAPMDAQWTTFVHRRAASELMMSLGIAYPDGLSSTVTVADWERMQRDQDRLSQADERKRLFVKLQAIPGVQETLSAQDQELLKALFGLRNWTVVNVRVPS